MFWTRAVEKIKTPISSLIPFFVFRKSFRLWDNVQKFGKARGATYYVTIWRIRVSCWLSWLSKAHTHASGHRTIYVPTRARAHAQICNTYCFFTAIMIREHASVLRYTYIACLVFVIWWGDLYKSPYCATLFSVLLLSVCSFHGVLSPCSEASCVCVSLLVFQDQMSRFF